jgi:hypothetical protein
MIFAEHKKKAEPPLGDSTFIVTFVSAKIHRNDEQKYAFYRTADVRSAVKFAGQAKNPQNQSRERRRAICEAFRRMAASGHHAICRHQAL